MAAVLPYWRLGTLSSLRISSGRSNILIPIIPQYLSSWVAPLLALPTFQSLLELFPPFLLAVPKKKVSHSRKAMRAANKGLKDKTNIVNCPGCGSAKLAHHLCPECYSSVNRAWKARQKGLGVGMPQSIPIVEA